jgi:flagellar hook protein FlgE
LYFTATANPNVWNVNMTVSTTIGTGASAVTTTTVAAPPTSAGAPNPVTLTFDQSGGSAASNVPAPEAIGHIPFTYQPPGAALMNMDFDFSKTTQYGAAFGVTAITQDGYATGQLSTVAIDGAGIVSAVYTNGRSTQLGQLAMANFPNPQGLKQLGNTNYSETFSSGDVVQGTAASASFGSIQSGALESSNVDLTTELVNMITAQRAFDSNAQVITTANQESQTIIRVTGG